MNYLGVEVIQVLGSDGLKQKVYRFHVIRDTQINLCYYADQERPSRRHKFRSIRYWQFYREREGNIRHHEIDIPISVINQAVKEIREMLQYKAPEVPSD